MPRAKRKSPPKGASEQPVTPRTLRSQPKSHPSSLTPPAAAQPASVQTSTSVNLVTPTRRFTLDGKYLVDVFKHVIQAVSPYKDKWFTAQDWISVFPTFWSALMGREAEMKTAVFTKAMNNDPSLGGELVLRNYYEGNELGVFSNKYEFTDIVDGAKKRIKTYCYLFTKPYELCPFPPPTWSHTICFRGMARLPHPLM